MALAVAGAVVVVATQAFRPSVVGWVTFGVALGVLGLLILGARGQKQSMLDLGTGALALWSAVASVVYSGTTLTWLSFSEGCAFVALAIVGLVDHELKTERVVHPLEAVPREGRDGGRSEDLQVAA